MNASPAPVSRSALVTGASQGLRRAITLRLAAEGHRVIVNSFASPAASEATERKIRARGGPADAVRADVREPVQVTHSLVEACRIFGDVAGAGAYLAANEAAFVSGQTLAVNGGNAF